MTELSRRCIPGIMAEFSRPGIHGRIRVPAGAIYLNKDGGEAGGAIGGCLSQSSHLHLPFCSSRVAGRVVVLAATRPVQAEWRAWFGGKHTYKIGEACSDVRRAPSADDKISEASLTAAVMCGGRLPQMTRSVRPP